MKKRYKFIKCATAAICITVITGCMSTGMAGLGAAMGGGPLGAIGGAVLNSVVQSMAGSVLNGQIGSQAVPADQNFRLKQLGGLVQSGSVGQAQQWVNPQTGSKVSVTPMGQSESNPQTQQQCQNIDESLTSSTGQTIHETRVACLDVQTGKWNLVK